MKDYKSKYVERSLDEKKQILTSIWLETTKDMNNEEFKEEMHKLVEIIKEKNIKFILSVTKDLNFPITPELQNWVLEFIAPQFTEAKIEKQAMIIPKELIAQLSIEQTIDDVESSKHSHQSKLFSDIEEAKKWFFND